MKTKNIIIIVVIAAALIYLFRDKIFGPKTAAKAKADKGEDSENSPAGSASTEAPARPLTEAEKAHFRSLKNPTPKPAVIAQPAKQPTTRRRVVVK